MRLSPLFSLFCLSFGVDASLLRGGRSLQDENDPSFSGMSVTEPFEPLDCNDNILPCVPFTSVYGNRGTFTNLVIVPCGECYTMDYTGGVMKFESGLDIRGKLVFPDNYQVTVEASMVVVQGELEITSTRPVNGNPLIHFVLRGSNGSGVFFPIHNNRNICPVSCAVGFNSFTVAGGKVTIQGLPLDTPTWLKLYDVENPSTIVVSDAVLGKWAPGSTIVITSNDQRYFGEQVREVVGVSSDGRGYARLMLNETITRPNTQKDDVGFAVEVALLSRNIRIEGEPNGHFWFLYTPYTVQTVEGVEFMHMGQAGQLGRYPIHLHMCGNMKGSRIAKNSIVNSFQRGVVIHGTDNVQIEENVAYNVKGHCFLLEDGIETGNVFYKNIGIKNLNADILIPPSMLTGQETDNDVATFWITNANNSWVENVVAGSQSNGFWFELRIRGIRAEQFSHIDPLTVPIVEFKDNEIHSVFGFGLRYYLFGFLPEVVQTFDGTRFCRNRHVALQLHRTRNILVTNSYFSDNSVSIVVDRAESIFLENVVFIGYSQAYRNVVEKPDLLSLEPCGGALDRLEGVKFQPTNPWANNRTEPSLTGLTMKDVSFEGYAKGPCSYNTAIHLLPDRFTFSTFEMFVRFERVFTPLDTIDFCDGVEIEAFDAYVSDVTTSLLGGVTSKPSSLVADSPNMLHFTDNSRCEKVANMCTVYCRDTCFRTVHYYIPQSDSGNLQLRVCDMDLLSSCITLNGYTHLGHWPRRFTLHVPSDRRYDVVFVTDGQEVYPANVQTVFERKLCPSAPNEENIVLRSLPLGETPNPTTSPTTFFESCSSIVENGDMELGFTGYWHAFDTVSLYTTEGYDSATAIGVTGRERHWHGAMYAAERINLGCFTPGSLWRVSAKMKLINSTTGVDEDCNSSTLTKGETCPVFEVLLRVGEWHNIVARDVTGFSTSIVGDFSMFEGFFDVPRSGPVLGVEMQFTDYELGLDLIIDDFDISRHIQPRSQPVDKCSHLVQQPVDSELNEHWYAYGAGTLALASGVSGVGVAYNGRDRFWNGLGYDLNAHADKRCMTQGSGWQISAQMKLVDAKTGMGAACSVTSKIAGESCPKVEIFLRDRFWDRVTLIITGFDHYWDPYSFNEFRGFFWFPMDSETWVGDVRDSVLIITDYPLGTNLIVDDFSIRRLES